MKCNGTNYPHNIMYKYFTSYSLLLGNFPYVIASKYNNIKLSRQYGLNVLNYVKSSVDQTRQSECYRLNLNRRNMTCVVANSKY